jgi:hypothetical protein
MRPLFGLTQYLNTRHQLLWEEVLRASYCLGAVVFTLHMSVARPTLTGQYNDSVEKSAYLESNRIRVRVLQAESLRHLVLKGSWLG